MTKRTEGPAAVAADGPVKLVSWNSITICGAKGSGKTTLEHYLLKFYPQVFAFDTLEEFPEIQLRHIPRTDSPSELDLVANKVLTMANCCLLVSEAEIYLPVHKPLPPNVLKLVTRGRHYNCALVVDTRRLANLNKTVFSLSDHCFIFRHFSPADTRYLEEFLPDVSRVPNLGVGEFIHYAQGHMSYHQPVKV